VSLCFPQAFKRGPHPQEVFFAELVYERSKDVFQRLGVQQLPFVFHWGPDAVVREGRSIKIPKSSEVSGALCRVTPGA
jgi:hypothetical protein